MGEMSITLDCDVLNADGGTRCAAITGAWVALSLAFRHLVKMNVIKTVPLTGQVAAVSCGIVGGDAGARPGLRGGFHRRRRRQLRADRQPAASSKSRPRRKRPPFSEAQFLELLALARKGTAALFAAAAPGGRRD